MIGLLTSATGMCFSFTSHMATYLQSFHMVSLIKYFWNVSRIRAFKIIVSTLSSAYIQYISIFYIKQKATVNLVREVMFAHPLLCCTIVRSIGGGWTNFSTHCFFVSFKTHLKFKVSCHIERYVSYKSLVIATGIHSLERFIACIKQQQKQFYKI